MTHFSTRASVPTRPRERGSRPFPIAMASLCCASVVPSAPVRAANRGRRTRASAVPAPRRLKIPDDSTRTGDACVTHATKETYASFDDMIERSPVPVLVDFYATWCGPCQMLSRDVLPKVAGAVGKDRVKLVVGSRRCRFLSASFLLLLLSLLPLLRRLFRLRNKTRKDDRTDPSTSHEQTPPHTHDPPPSARAEDKHGKVPQHRVKIQGGGAPDDHAVQGGEGG